MTKNNRLRELEQNLKELDAFTKEMRGITAEEYEKVRDSYDRPPQYAVKLRLGKPLRAIVFCGDDYVDYIEKRHEVIMGEKTIVMNQLRNTRLCEVNEHTGGDYVIYGLDWFRKDLEARIRLAAENPEEFSKQEFYPREIEDIAADLIWDSVLRHSEPERHKEVVRECIDRLEEYYEQL